jgi:hypothetical protein
MNRDGSGRSNIVPYPVGNTYFISPDRHWITANLPQPVAATFAVPVNGDTPPIRICGGCPVTWDRAANFIYVPRQRPSSGNSGKALAIPLSPGQMLPQLPETGVPNDPAGISGARMVEGYFYARGNDPSVYAYVKTTMHRNLFRIPLNDE